MRLAARRGSGTARACRRGLSSAPDVKIVEVGPRDGLQNERQVVPTETKIALIEKLAAAGLRSIESTAFVSPKWVPQMADAARVMAGISRVPGTTYSALVPNVKGLQAAIESNVTEVAVFPAASEAFCRANLNCSVAESLERCRAVCEAAVDADIAVRGYISCSLGCPYQGEVEPRDVSDVAFALFSMGCYEVSLGDTIGIGTPGTTMRLLDELAPVVPVSKLAVHLHDTYGQALANIVTALGRGVTVVDAAVSGLGGCPYAKGATGNVATEDVLYMLEGMGVSTGIDMGRLLDAGEYIRRHLAKPTASRAAAALLARRKLSADNVVDED